MYGIINQKTEKFGFVISNVEFFMINPSDYYQFAISNFESNKWLEVMNTEMKSIKDDRVQDLLIFLHIVRLQGVIKFSR